MDPQLRRQGANKLVRTGEPTSSHKIPVRAAPAPARATPQITSMRAGPPRSMTWRRPEASQPSCMPQRPRPTNPASQSGQKGSYVHSQSPFRLQALPQALHTQRPRPPHPVQPVQHGCHQPRHAGSSARTAGAFHSTSALQPNSRAPVAVHGARPHAHGAARRGAASLTWTRETAAPALAPAFASAHAQAPAHALAHATAKALAQPRTGQGDAVRESGSAPLETSGQSARSFEHATLAAQPNEESSPQHQHLQHPQHPHLSVQRQQLQQLPHSPLAFRAASAAPLGLATHEVHRAQAARASTAAHTKHAPPAAHAPRVDQPECRAGSDRTLPATSSTHPSRAEGAAANATATLTTQSALSSKAPAAACTSQQQSSTRVPSAPQAAAEAPLQRKQLELAATLLMQQRLALAKLRLRQARRARAKAVALSAANAASAASAPAKASSTAAAPAVSATAAMSSQPAHDGAGLQLVRCGANSLVRRNAKTAAARPRVYISPAIRKRQLQLKTSARKPAGRGAQAPASASGRKAGGRGRGRGKGSGVAGSNVWTNPGAPSVARAGALKRVPRTPRAGGARGSACRSASASKLRSASTPSSRRSTQRRARQLLRLAAMPAKLGTRSAAIKKSSRETVLRLSMDFKAQREREEKARAKSEARALEQCSYFGRFGSCLRTGVECPYAHDVTKVSVCQRFLHNECDDGELCLLSHELIPQRMPVCRLFVAGLCISSACPFSHVNLGKDAELCKTFSRVGYCEEGDACSARHELTCYAWRTKGYCALGEACKLRRPRRPRAPATSGTAAHSAHTCARVVTEAVLTAAAPAHADGVPATALPSARATASQPLSSPALQHTMPDSLLPCLTPNISRACDDLAL